MYPWLSWNSACRPEHVDQVWLSVCYLQSLGNPRVVSVFLVLTVLSLFSLFFLVLHRLSNVGHLTSSLFVAKAVFCCIPLKEGVFQCGNVV